MHLGTMILLLQRNIVMNWVWRWVKSRPKATVGTPSVARRLISTMLYTTQNRQTFADGQCNAVHTVTEVINSGSPTLVASAAKRRVDIELSAFHCHRGPMVALPCPHHFHRLYDN